MNTRLRLTKVLCPECQSRRAKPRYLKPIPCPLCKGTGRASVAAVREHVAAIRCFAFGGYVEGDYSLEEFREKEAEANKIERFVKSLEPV